MKKLYIMIRDDIREELSNPVSFGLAFILPFALFVDLVNRIIVYNGNYIIYDFVIFTFIFYFLSLLKSAKKPYKIILMAMTALNYSVFMFLAVTLLSGMLEDGLWIGALIYIIAITTITYFQFRNIKRLWCA